MELRARAKRDRTRFHELKSVSKKGGHSRAVPRREAGKHVREEGRNRRWTSSEGGQPGDNHWIAGGGVRTYQERILLHPDRHSCTQGVLRIRETIKSPGKEELCPMLGGNHPQGRQKR